MATALVVALAFVGALPALAGDTLALHFADDAFYYFTLARRLAASEGLTFDGIHSTNGFHPLWLALIAPIFRFVPGDYAPLRAVIVLQGALLVSGALVLCRNLRPRIGPWGAFVGSAAFTLFPLSSSMLATGMESAVSFLSLVVVWDRWLAVRERPTPHGWLVLGVACAVAFAARLETAMVIVGIGLVERRRGVDALLRLAAPLAVCAGAYVTWNVHAFGTWLPISGRIKEELARGEPVFPAAILDVPWLGRDLIVRLYASSALATCPPRAKALYLALLVVTVIAAWVYRRSIADAGARSGAGLLFAMVAPIVVCDQAMLHGAEVWAQFRLMLPMTVLLGALATRAPRFTRVLGVGLAVAAPLVAVWTVWALQRNAPARYGFYRIEAGRWLEAHLPPGERAGSWNAGTIGYFSHRPIVNLDGHVNDRAFFDRAIRGRDLVGYLRDERIDWLVDQECGEAPPPTAYLARAGAESLASQFQVAAEFVQRADPDRCPGVVAWRRDTSPAGSPPSEPP